MAILDQSFTTTPDSQASLRYNAATKIAQEFITVFTINVQQVDLLLYKTSIPTGNIWTEIWSDTGSDLPSAKIGNSSANVDVSTLGTDTGGAYITFTWATAPPTVIGTKYWLVLNGDYTASTQNFANWKMLSTGGYASGVPAYWDGAQWEKTTIGTTADLNFKEYGDRSSGFFAFL